LKYDCVVGIGILSINIIYGFIFKSFLIEIVILSKRVILQIVPHEEIDSKGHMNDLTEMDNSSKQLSNLNNNVLAPEGSLEGDIKM